MKCKNCGKRIKKQELFCPSCGYYNGDATAVSWDDDQDLLAEEIKEEMPLKEEKENPNEDNNEKEENIKEEFVYENEDLLEDFIGEDLVISYISNDGIKSSVTMNIIGL